MKVIYHIRFTVQANETSCPTVSNGRSLAWAGLKDFINFKQQWIPLVLNVPAGLDGKMPEAVGGGAAQATCKKSVQLQYRPTL